MENSKRSFLWNEFWYTNLAKILIPNNVKLLLDASSIAAIWLLFLLKNTQIWLKSMIVHFLWQKSNQFNSIPKSVKRVGNYRFLNCHNLETIILIIELKLNEIYQKVDYNLSKIYLNWITWQRKYHFLYGTNRDHNNWKKCI